MNVETSNTPRRCDWATSSDLMRVYHDEEWGVPVHDDRKLFEYVVLDSFQAGLSWEIILRKREGFREAFHDFEPERVAAMTEQDVERLLTSASIVRNAAKIRATIGNARATLAVAAEFGSLDAYLWSFVGGRTIHNHWTSTGEIPAATAESASLSTNMKRRGFRFAGPTIIYAVMQSAGLVNDHVTGCFRYEQLKH